MNKINNTKKILFIILLLNIAIPSHLFSQNKYKRKISISEWIEEMENCKKRGYLLENTEIYFDYRKDTLYSWNKPRTIKPTAKDEESVKIISPIILIRNCKLPAVSTCQVRNIVFQNNIIFHQCEGASQFIFYNCTFKQGLELNLSELNQIEFRYCSILQRIVVNRVEMSELLYSNCNFYTDSKPVISPFHYGFETENQTYQYLFVIRQNHYKIINNFSLSKCKILPTKVKPIISINGRFDIMHFEEIDFSNSIVDFRDCSIKENFIVKKCEFNQPLGTRRFSFPKDNTSFIWSQLDSVGIGLYGDYAQAPHTSKTDTLISDRYTFNELNSSYRKFFSMYRTQGDIKSANACYNQMKDMETHRYHHLYQQNPSINNWFNWRFNQFLKYFSEYGTNPVKSLIVSMWTILIFAIVYFFFYSDWDTINRTFLIKRHRKLMQYFRSEQRLEDFYTENYIEDFKTFADYKKEMAESKSELPFFIILLGKPLYLLSIIRHKILAFIYRRTEILQGRWTDLNSSRKIYVALVVGFLILVYMIYLFFVRAINSITLSINAFSTLGFGAIPVKGASRYITILEGFLGWFLLSIFSVSLIGQMLQN